MDRFIKKITKEAGDAVVKLFGKTGVQYTKSIHAVDAVTKADLLAEHIIISKIQRVYPNHGILSEERGGINTDAEYVWIIDPVDGTLNFASSIPMFGTMVCLVNRKKIVLAAIYLPVMNEFFFAKAGQGAFLNGRRIKASQNKKREESLGCFSSNQRGRSLAFLKKFVNSSKGFTANSFGSIAVGGSYVASGRRDWLVSFGASVWDYAPISLIMKEAGCKVTNAKGQPWQVGDKDIVSANPYLHQTLVKLSKTV